MGYFLICSGFFYVANLDVNFCRSQLFHKDKCVTSDKNLSNYEKNLSNYEGQTFVVRSWTNFFRSWTNFFRSWTNFFRSWTNFCQTSHICLYETTTKDKNCRIFLLKNSNNRKLAFSHTKWVKILLNSSKLTSLCKVRS